MASHVKVIEALLTEIRDRSYRAAVVVSAALVAWAWLLTWIAQAWPSLTGLVACLAVPYLAWTYLPVRLIQVIELALVPGLLSAPSLPLIEGTELTTAQWGREAIGSVLIVFVAGALYASLTRLFKRARMGRLPIIWRWTLAQGVGSLVTALHLLIGLFIQAFGRTPALGVVSDIAYWLVYLPMQVVQFVYAQEPTLQRWGDWDVGTMLAGTGLLATLIAIVLAVPLLMLPLRHRRGAVQLTS
jgi:hypothetical protein